MSDIEQIKDFNTIVRNNALLLQYIQSRSACSPLLNWELLKKKNTVCCEPSFLTLKTTAETLIFQRGAAVKKI